MKLYNSLTQQLEQFTPLQQAQVTLYVCGITPNNATHLGHAFTYVMFDILKRYLEHRNYTVSYAQNTTDVNDSDDVIKQAKEAGKTWREVADYWTAQFLDNMKALNVLKPTYYIPASFVISDIITMNKRLISLKHAYEKKGSVYFDISTFPEYGKLSNYSINLMRIFSSVRGNNLEDPNKKNPLDFVLWIADTSEPNWDSPWGKGRPGWHIECSAISYKYLGPQIDIHGGGRDLIFPHHESEIAQSESYTEKKPFVMYWVHIGTVLLGGEKMAKSLGNLVVVSDLLKKYSANSIRWYLISHHYRSPWEYNEKELIEKVKEYNAIEKVLQIRSNDKKAFSAEYYIKHIEHAFNQDLNIPEVQYFLNHLAERIYKEKDRYNISQLQETLRKYTAILGFTS